MMSGLSETERDEYDFVLAALRAEHPKPLTSLSIMKLAPKDLEHLDPANVDYIANTMKSVRNALKLLVLIFLLRESKNLYPLYSVLK